MVDDYIIGEVDDAKEKEVLTNAYHFGQFFAMHITLRIKDIYGLQRAIEFLESRYKSFAREHPNYYQQMIKVDKEAYKSSEDEYKKFMEKQLNDDNS